MDFIVIAVVNSLCRYAATYLRMILSATFGAMGAVIVCLVPQEYKFAANIVSYICIGMGMVRICAGNVAFAELIKGFFALYAAAFMLGGVNNISKVVSKISRPTKGRLLCYSIFGGNFG